MRVRNVFAYSIFIALALVPPGASAQETQPKKPPEVPFVPTRDFAVQDMLKLAGVKSTDVVYDLGSGDGRIVIAAAKTYGAHGVGIDIDPKRISEAKENARLAGVEDLVRFEENDLFKADIHEATVVTLFLLPGVNQRLRPKLQSELKPGARIVSNTFDMGDWKPDKEAIVEAAPADAYFSRRLLLWIIPERN